MRIAIHTVGTRGDIQPYLALAVGLKVEGHEVLIAAPSQYSSWIQSFGIGYHPLPGEFLELLETPEAKAMIAGGSGFSAGFKLIKHFKPIGRKQLTEELKAAREFKPQLMIYHPKAIGVPHLAEWLACPTVLASPLPGFTPTGTFASPMVPFRSLGPLNRLTHSFMANGGEAMFHAMIAEWRETEVGLPKRAPRRHAPDATLYAYSQHVIPRAIDWPSNVEVTGYWFLEDTSWLPDAKLTSFIKAGSAPVYVGFGSMPGLDPVQLTKTVVDALAFAGRRGVLAAGGGAIGGVSADHVHVIDQAPHCKRCPTPTFLPFVNHEIAH